LPGNKKLQKIAYKDLDYVLYDGYKFEAQTKRLKKGNFSAYFVIAETDTKKLYGMAIEGSMTYFEMVITDKNNTVLEENDFMITDTKHHIKNRAKVASLIEEHFADCSELLERMRMLQSAAPDEKNKWAMDFLRSPTYINCSSN
jgi:hypothetical protein